MATSPPPGTTSSNTGTSDTELLRLLQETIESPALTSLHNTLGRDADLHLVGGTVRELALRNTETDIDLATVLPPKVVLDRLKNANIRVVETGITHGTVLAVIDDVPIEITTFRLPGSRNACNFSDSITKDLAGRDFTINAIAFSFNSNSLVDPQAGLADLAAKTLRAVVDPAERFKEDPHRILRMIRFGPGAGFTVEETTRTAAKECAPLVQNVSTERIQTELAKILVSAEPGTALTCMRSLGLIDLLLPELVPTFDCEQNEFHIHDVFEHTLWVLERAEPDLLLRLAALFHDAGKPATLSVDEDGRRHFYKHELVSADLCKTALERLMFPKRLTADVTLLVEHHMRPLDCGPAAVRRLLRDLGERFDDWLRLKCADAPPTMPEAEFQALYENFLEMKTAEETRQAKASRSGLAISGKDLLALGISPGPEMGRVLHSLEEHILDTPEDNSPEFLLSLVKERFSSLLREK